MSSANFQAGVRYTFSLYSCSSEAPEVLQRWQGYMQELGKDSTACGKLILLEEAITSEIILIVYVLVADSLFSFSLLCLPHFIPSLWLPQSPPVLSLCQPLSRTLMFSSSGERSRWSTEEASSWATTFTLVMAPSSHI